MLDIDESEIYNMSGSMVTREVALLHLVAALFSNKKDYHKTTFGFTCVFVYNCIQMCSTSTHAYLFNTFRMLWAARAKQAAYLRTTCVLRVLLSPVPQCVEPRCLNP